MSGHFSLGGGHGQQVCGHQFFEKQGCKVLSLTGAGLEAGGQPLNQGSPPEVLCHL